MSKHQESASSPPVEKKSPLDRIRKSEKYQVKLVTLEFLQGIYDRMRDEGLTARKLAGRYGASEARISQFLSGRENSTLETMVKFADALDSTVHIAVVPRNHWFEARFHPISAKPVRFDDLSSLSGTTSTDHLPPSNTDNVRPFRRPDEKKYGEDVSATTDVSAEPVCNQSSGDNDVVLRKATS
ncbi:MAG TPA: helix-turn-helix transcriptional regulator [Thermoanaerobaculia bacterium]|nr:helix-turn-helix transcriptional regulator [Thermoanaerobaculia bacterium]